MKTPPAKSIEPAVQATNELAIQVTLDDLMDRLLAEKITHNEFVREINAMPILPEIVGKHLAKAYSEFDLLNISYLTDCLRSESYRLAPNAQKVISLFCEIMADSRCDRCAEEIADALCFIELEKSTLPYFVKACTSSIHKVGDSWSVSWDIRKALEAMYGMYVYKAVEKEEIIPALKAILDYPNMIDVDSRYPDLAHTFIKMIEENNQ